MKNKISYRCQNHPKLTTKLSNILEDVNFNWCFKCCTWEERCLKISEILDYKFIKQEKLRVIENLFSNVLQGMNFGKIITRY